MLRVQPKYWGLLAASILFIGVAQIKIRSAMEWTFPKLTDLVATEHYAGDLGALMLGTRRLAGDLAYIQFLQYYGVERDEDGRPAGEDPHGHGHHHGGRDYGGGHYPRVPEFGRRIMNLDPYFNAPILEIAGALAFNIKKSADALAVLEDAIRLDPSFHRYRLYVAAILYKNNAQDEKLISMLERDIQYRDCPALLKLVLGNLLKKYNHYERAAAVYINVVKTAPAEGDRETAKNRLTELIKERPYLASLLSE
jgi:tetratricopeptide (TPR) repeat protein